MVLCVSEYLAGGAPDAEMEKEAAPGSRVGTIEYRAERLSVYPGFYACLAGVPSVAGLEPEMKPPAPSDYSIGLSVATGSYAYLAGEPKAKVAAARKAEMPQAQTPGSGLGIIGPCVDAWSWSCSYLAGHGHFPKIQMACELLLQAGIIGLRVDDQLGLVRTWQVLLHSLGQAVKAAGWGPLGLVLCVIH